MSSLIAAVLNSVWQSLALALCVWTALRCMPRMNAATRHAIWWAALAVLVALPAGPPLYEMARGAANRAPRQQTASAAHNSEAAPAPSVVPPAAVPAPRPLPMRVPAPVELRGEAWFVILPAVWFAVLLLQLTRLAWSFRHVRRLKRRARPAPPALQQSFEAWMRSCRVDRPARLLVSNEIASPMAVGFRKPAVILPESLLANFREDELDHVLLHELAHLARRDDWTNLAARVAAAAVALHPVAAWTLRRIEREREIACDDWVVSMTGEARPYARSLTRLFEVCWTRKRVLLASGMAGRPSQLGERIEELLRRREFAPGASVNKVFMSVLALLVFGLAAAGTPRWIVLARSAPQPVEAEPPRPRTPRVVPVQKNPIAPQRAASQSAVTPAPPPGGFLAALVAAGYGDIPVDEIVALKNAGVSAEFLLKMSESGWSKLPARELMDLRNHGVSPSYAAQVRVAGYLRISDVIELKQHGVRPEFVRDAHDLGFGPFSSREAIDLFSQGVRTELLEALKDGGFVRATAKDIIDAQQAGVRDSHFREAKHLSSSLTLQQVIKLKHAGVLK